MRGDKETDPIMQLLGNIKKIPDNAKKRFRISLSDGQYFIPFGLLSTNVSTQINDQVMNGELTPNTIVKVKRYESVITKDKKRALIILELEILEPGEETAKIGDPKILPDNIDLESTSGDVHIETPSTSTSNRNSEIRNYNNGDIVSVQRQSTRPISSLSPHQNKWTIKALVRNKSQILPWTNGKGQLFKMEFIDETGEIQATVFHNFVNNLVKNNNLVEKFYSMIEVDKIYYISKCTLKAANKQYSRLNHDSEIIFTNNTVVEECHDVVTSIPQTQFNFVSIDKIAAIETGSFVDVLGVCKAVSDLEITQKGLKKREVTLLDQSQNVISLILWQENAEKFDGTCHSIISIKGARVGEFGGGKNIGINTSSIMKINPDSPDSRILRTWYENGGMYESVNNISDKNTWGNFPTPWLSFEEVQNQGLGNSERGDLFQTVGTILLFRSTNCLYKACPTNNCNKKVIDSQNEMFYCGKCNRDFPNFKYRLLGSINVRDWSGDEWITMFGLEAEKVLGMTLQEVGLAVENNPEILEEIVDRAKFQQFLIQCRVKMDIYNGEARLKIIATKVDPINHQDYNSYLFSKIQQIMMRNNNIAMSS